MTRFFAWVDQLSGHAAIVAGVGFGFLVVQLLLSLRVYLRAASQDRMLKRLASELEWGGDARCELAEAPRRFRWLRWVLEEFPAAGADGVAPASRFTRDEALHELDVRIASDPAYLMLQRMSIMAPLIGVVLTVTGFYWLDVDQAGEQSLQMILTAVTPLVSGVGAGAVLALINQVLLHVAGGRMETLRMTARAWFDGAIWRHVAGVGDGAEQNAMVSHERFAKSLAAAAAQFERTVAAFQHDMDGIPGALRGARDALAASAAALEELLPAATRSVSNLDVSVAAFRTTVDREFHDAAVLHHRASKTLAAAVADISDAAEMLKSARGEAAHVESDADMPPAMNGDAPHETNGGAGSVRPR
jgi:hypothetical protein